MTKKVTTFSSLLLAFAAGCTPPPPGYQVSFPDKEGQVTCHAVDITLPGGAGVKRLSGYDRLATVQMAFNFTSEAGEDVPPSSVVYRINDPAVVRDMAARMYAGQSCGVTVPAPYKVAEGSHRIPAFGMLKY